MTLFQARQYYRRPCTCGERQECTMRYYTTNRGGQGIDGGMGACGKVRAKIKEYNRHINISNTNRGNQ